MRPDPVAVEDARAWLGKAGLDLRAASADLAFDPQLLGDAAFHCQQAVEKALKAVLSLHDRPFRKTHDLKELTSEVEALEPGFGLSARMALPLTEYAWEFRYPGDVWEPPREEVDAALVIAREVVAAATRVLNDPGGGSQ